MTFNAMNTVLFGDVRATLAALPACLFHCAVTSPPYWNLRSYLKSDDPMKHLEIGSEKTPDEFVATMVSVFREVRRVLRNDGCLWLNMGDSYGRGPRTNNPNDSLRGVTGNTGQVAAVKNGSYGAGEEQSDGNQLLMPHRVAMALQNDGWILRSTIIWAKKSPMPESISGVRWRQCRVKVGRKPTATQRNASFRNNSTQYMSQQDLSDNGDFREREVTAAQWLPCPGCDKCRDTGGLVLRRGKWRPTTAHEYIFLFSKSESYFCDGDAVQEAQSAGTIERFGKNNSMRCAGGKSQLADQGNTLANGDYKRHLQAGIIGSRNPRSVWTLSSEPYKGAHFATFPTELARRCIAASTSSVGCCPECGAAYAPVVSSERVPTRPGLDNQIGPAGMANRDPQRHVAVTRVRGYLPTCQCGVGHPEPCRVLDPFGGSGTVGQVAKHLGRNYVLCELNRDYLPLIEARIETVPRWKKVNGKPQPKPIPGQRELF